jgi:hypothetical protein
MVPAKCIEECKDSLVRVEENRRKAVFRNDGRGRFLRVKIDGCAVLEATAADWVVCEPGVGDVIIELKGQNVSHGIRQVSATTEYWLKNRSKANRFAGLVVCSQYPRVNASIQRATQDFVRKYKSPLHVVAKNHEYNVKHVLSFKGPHRG